MILRGFLFFQLRDEFKQTFIIVTHNRKLAQMADRGLVMREGDKSKRLKKSFFKNYSESFSLQGLAPSAHRP